MRCATLRTAQGTRAAIRSGEEWVLQPEPHVGELLLDATWRSRGVAAGGTGRVAVEDADLAPVLPRPGKIICIGLNYRTHITEMGRDLPSHPTLFAKFAESLVGAYDDIVLPEASPAMDWEAELAVVVGAPLRHADEATARGGIAGFAVANDVTARDWQYRTTQWLQGKTFEATTPLGPELVTPEEVDHAADLHVECLLDGRTVQDTTTADLVFGPAELLSYASTICTLQVGDVVLTGTTGGVGHARKPPQYLSAGAVLTTAIAGLGRCINPCVAEKRDTGVDARTAPEGPA